MFWVANSHMPATNCARPPTKRAMPTTTFGWVIPLAWTLYNDRTNVVDAKPNNPLCERTAVSATRSLAARREDHVQRSGVTKLAVVLRLTAVRCGRGVGRSEFGLSFLEVGHGVERAVGGERRVDVGERWRNASRLSSRER